jgi:hypothetical protein
MKAGKLGKKDWRKRGRYGRALRREAGYVLPWVLIMALVAGLIIGPFLMFMLSGVSASYSYADTMAEFYAADSGVEDAIYKIQSAYSADTVLTDDITSSQIDIPVDSTVLFPKSGVIQIEDELVYYADKDATNFLNCQRGYDSTTNKAHDDATPVTIGLPEGVAATWEYSIEDVNDKQVDIAVESLWLLDGLEDPSHGTTPHAELVVVGQMLEVPSTALSGDIDDDDLTIPVLSTDGFPEASTDDPSVIRIGDELIQYTAKTATTFTVPSDGRGYNHTLAVDHDHNDGVTSEEVTYHVDITYDGSKGPLKIKKVGVWMPAGFSYVPGSSNMYTALDSMISSATLDIDVDTDAPYNGTDRFPDSGVIAIEHELIDYTSKSSDEFDDCDRGQYGTTAVAHGNGTLVTAEPNQVTHHGGTALEWYFGDPESSSGWIYFEDLPNVVTGFGGASPPTGEFPTKRTLTFNFSPAGDPKGIFSWIRTIHHDIYLSWDTSSGVYKISSTATDPSTGTSTTLNSYVGTCKLTDRVSAVYGDARAIGNSLMRDTNHDSDHIKDTLNSPFESTAEIDDIPDDATVEAAYLYWSAYKRYPDDIGDVATLTPAELQALKEQVDEATFITDIGTSPITADRVQVQRRWLSGPQGWVYSAFKDVTDYLLPEQSATITMSPVSDVETESVDINRINGNPARVRINAENPPNPDEMTLDRSPHTVAADGTQTGDINVYASDSPLVLTSGSTAGTYEARVRRYAGTLEVDGQIIDNSNRNAYVTLETTATAPVPGMATITRLTTTAQVLITAINLPEDGYITVSGASGPATLDEGSPSVNRNLFGGTPDTLTCGSLETYQATIVCNSGMVRVNYGSSGSVILGEPGSQITNGEYTVGYLEGITDEDTGDSGSYAGWSLIVIYSSPTEEAHQLFLYDTLNRINQSTPPSLSLVSTVTGFIAPADFEGRMTCFVGEGDEGYTGDSIKVNDYLLPRPGDPYDGVNHQNDVWNSLSSGLAGESIDGIDIDTFDVSDLIDEGDTSATLKFYTGQDGWALIYVFLSFKTVPTEESGGFPVGILSFGYGGGG